MLQKLKPFHGPQVLDPPAAALDRPFSVVGVLENAPVAKCAKLR